MEYLLLIEHEAATLLYSLPARAQARVQARLRELLRSPDWYSDYHLKDQTGRLIDVTLVGGWALHYWIDFPDRHIKVLKIVPADK